jgi:hypothetical protein
LLEEIMHKRIIQKKGEISSYNLYTQPVDRDINNSMGIDSNTNS